MEPLPGDRVVVRYRLGEGGPADWRTAGAERADRISPAPTPAGAHTPSLSDVTGFLIERNDDELVVERDGVTERIPAAAITSIRRLSTTTVRNSEIRALERTLTEATPAAERAELDGWTVSASPGAASSGPRANAAVPLEFGAGTAALADIAAWYLDRGLPARVVVPERLLRLADVSRAPGAGSSASGPHPSGAGSSASGPHPSGAGSSASGPHPSGAGSSASGPHPSGAGSSASGPIPSGAEYEVLVGPDGDPVEVAGADRRERARLRSLGYRLHHTFTVVDLDPGGST